MTSREFMIVLRIITDDPEEDLRLYPFERAFEAPGDAPPRFTKVVSAVEIRRGSRIGGGERG